MGGEQEEGRAQAEAGLSLIPWGALLCGWDHRAAPTLRLQERLHL